MSRRSKRKPTAKAKSVAEDSTDIRLIFGVCIFLAAITWLVFGQTLRHEFVNYDDPSYVYDAPFVAGGFTVEGVWRAFTHRHSNNWHPLTTLSHMLDCQVYGLNPAGHHLTNVLLHTATAILLFLVLRQMTAAFWRSAFVAAVFAIHPLRVESVAWIAERKDVLSGLFFVLTLGAYVRYARNPPSLTKYLTVLLCFAFGLMAKPMLVTLPFVLLLLDYWPLNRFGRSPSPRQQSGSQASDNQRRLIVEKIPLLILSAGSCVATVLAQGETIVQTEQLTFAWRIANAVTSYATYLWQVFYPFKLAVLYPHLQIVNLQVWKVLGGIVLLLTITVWALTLRRIRPYLIAGWLWYCGMLVPVIGLMQVGWQARADRYTYLPHIGISIMLAWGVRDSVVQWGRQSRKVLGALGGAVIASLTLIAWKQTSYWRTTETLWTHTLAVTTRNPLAHASYADFLLSHDRVPEATTQLEKAIAVWPNYADAHRQLGVAFLRVGNLDGAITQWEIILALEPHDPNAESNLAWVLATCPQSSVRNGLRALGLMQDVIARSGRMNAAALSVLAAAYAECGRFTEALDTSKEALQLALAQGNSTLADNLRDAIGSYQNDIPLRDQSLADVRPPPNRPD